MSQRRVMVADIGEVILSKRHGSSNIRLSISTHGQVRVGMPYWTPYEAGLLFLLNKKGWVQEHLLKQAPIRLSHGTRIGKTYKIVFFQNKSKIGSIIKVSGKAINVTSDRQLSDPELQKQVYKACEKALFLEAKSELPPRIEALSNKYDLPYNQLRVRKLISRWGSCSNNKNISLSSYLVQLPWELVDYVIIHELAHTRFLNHSRDFWQLVE